MITRVRRVAVCLPLFFLALTEAPAKAGGVRDQHIARLTVDLSDQRVLVTTTGGEKVSIEISSGAPNTPTRLGSFKITSKTRVGMSGSNNKIRMDYFTRFDKGIGFHGIPWNKSRDKRLWTPLGQRGVSHGCVRMRDSWARWIFEKAPVGTPVLVQK
jgi:lipoprotein-anchoring transpeptidase ErfK/SrfK